jgi:phosphatidylglycerophosphatase C
MDHARPGLAVFDFDGTLTRRDSLIGFLRRLRGTSALAQTLLLSTRPIVRAARNDTERDAAKAAVVGRLLRGQTTDHVAAVGSAYAQHLAEHALRADARERIESHRSRGHRLAIVSASLEPYLAPLAAILGIDHLACTRVEERGGVLTGRLLGANCRRAEKAARLREILDPREYEVWAYGDSRGDLELLALADHPVWIGGRPPAGR